MQNRPRIIVIGSMNMDLVVNCQRMPAPGETLIGERFTTQPGGKGANQAVAAARLGGRVSMLGCVGADEFGQELRLGLEREGIETQFIQTAQAVSSGVALIQVDAQGENAITVVSGANSKVRVQPVSGLLLPVQQSDVMLLQLEIPHEEVIHAIQMAKEAGVTTILDPAPAPIAVVPEPLYRVDVLSPNQHEAESMTGVSVVDYASAATAARMLQGKGASNVVIKMGDQGALVLDKTGDVFEVPALRARAIDTTAAGDAFTAALGIGLGKGMSLLDAAQLGCVAGSLAVEKAGAQEAMPYWEAVAQKMARN